MTSFYEAATSGLNFDRFAMDELVNENTLIKMKQHFWTAKQLVRNKLGKKEDDHLMASDADFDTKLTTFYTIRDTSRGLLAGLENIHHFYNCLSDQNRQLGVLLIKQSRFQKSHVAKAMEAVGHVQGYSSKQSAALLAALVKLYRELDIFNDRAISDCASTAEAAEKARVEYRGSLLWMKKTSEELDPESDQQMEQYRTAQNVCRQNKEKLDKLKEDTFHKTDVLAESRSSFLLEATVSYMKDLHEYVEEMARSYTAVLEELRDIDDYEIDVLKILNDPMSLAVDAQKQKEKAPPKVAEREPKEADKEEEVPVEEENLFDLSDPQSRPVSPLGELRDLDEEQGVADSEREKQFVVGPLPALYDVESQSIPKLAPPAGWNHKGKTTIPDLWDTASQSNSSSAGPSEASATAANEDPEAKKWSDLLDAFDPLKQNVQTNSSEI